MTRSAFTSLSTIPDNEVGLCMQGFVDDPNPSKVNLTVGAYRDHDGKPWVLPSVRTAENVIHKRSDCYEYPAPPDNPLLLEGAKKLVFGSAANESMLSNIASLQTVAGTGANNIGARFLTKFLKPRRVWLPDPTWANHHFIWTVAAPEVEQATYPYYKPTLHEVDYQGMLDALESKAEQGDVLVLQACAHNPTGTDLTKDQWDGVAALCKSKEIFPLFDLAYQGLASGDVDEDASSIRLFVQRYGLEVGVAQSFSKNFGLYSERVGVFHLKTLSREACENAARHLTFLQVSEILVPPTYGALIVGSILSNDALKSQWEEDLRIMSGRMRSMRQVLWGGLKGLGTPGNWDHIVTDNGLFSYIGLTPEQIMELRSTYHIYMPRPGRMSIPGLTKSNVATVVKAIDAVVRTSGKN